MKDENFLYICFMLCACITQLRLLASIQEIFKANKKIVCNIGLSLFIGLLLLGATLSISNLPFIYLIIFASEVLICVLAFHLTTLQSCLVSCFYIFHMIALKGIMVGSLSLILEENSFLILEHPLFSIGTDIMVQVFLFLIFLLYRRILKVIELRTFMACKKQLVLVLGGHLTITLFLIFHSFSFYFNEDLVWLSITPIVIGLLLYIVYMIILKYGIYVADLLQHKVRDQSQIETIKQQLTQQSSLLKIEKIINHFKHDYREQILSVEYFIENNQKSKALEELKTDYLHILNDIPTAKKYSNNLILNSLLIDKQATCNELSISMNVSLYIPLDLSITEKQCHEIFRILIQNAMDANEKVNVNERYLNIKSHVEKQWLTVMIENPFIDRIQLKNGRPIPSDAMYDNEGLGLIFVEEVLHGGDGFVRYEVDEVNKIFKAVVLIPIQIL